MPAVGAAVVSASHQFAEHTSQMQWFSWDSESWTVDQLGNRPPNSDRDHFLVYVFL